MPLTSETVPYLLLNHYTGWHVANLDGAAIDEETGKLYLLAPPPVEATPQPCMSSNMRYRSEGTYLSTALDSEVYRCQWHRVCLTATVPSGSSITVATFTSETNMSTDQIKLLPDDDWVVGVGQTYSVQSTTLWDCLVRSQPGRYLWLRLVLESDGLYTPTIEQVLISYPRTPSLQYLPATYSEDPDSADTLARFLSIFDTMRDEIGHKVTNIARYFDPYATPINPQAETDFLSWLASWIGLLLDRRWPECKQRKLVAQAHRLYKLRGTAEGLREHIRIYTGAKPFILEHFKLRSWLFLNDSSLEERSTLWGKEITNRLQLAVYSQIGAIQLVDTSDPLHDPFDLTAHQFTVFVQRRAQYDEMEQQTLQQIIEMAKPAHTQGHLRIVPPQLRIGDQSFLGIGTVIGSYPAQVVLGESRLGQDSVLGPTTQHGIQIGKQSRIGPDTIS